MKDAPDRCFGDSYVACREVFLQAARAAGASLSTYRQPALGEADAGVDVAVLGSGPELHVLCSGAHGVELPFGSAVQAAFLQQGPKLSRNVTLILIHAINCYGTQHRRRFTEDNIDLCRNFAKPPLLDNPYYAEIADALNAHPDDGAQADAVLRQKQRELGRNFIVAVMGGQFSDPAGFSYGGRAPCWSRRTLESILAPYASSAACIFLDLHTGVGPYAVGTFVSLQTGGALARARSIFGEDVLAPLAAMASGGQLGEPTLHPAIGHPTGGIERLFKDAPVTFVVLEMGTHPPRETLPTLITEHRCERHGLAATERGLAAKALLWRQHAPTDAAWRRKSLGVGLKAANRLTERLAL